MRAIFRLIFFVGSIILAPFYFIKLKNLLFATNLKDPIQLYFWISFIGATLFFYAFMKSGSFFAIYEHELTHIIWGLLFFKSPRGFSVEEDYGGVVEIEGGNFLIALSPYFFQTLNFIMIPLLFLLKNRFHLYYFILFGILLGYHTSSTIKESWPGQPDFRVAGKLFSYVFIIFANLITYGVIFAFVQRRYEGMWLYLKSGFIFAVEFIKKLSI